MREEPKKFTSPPCAVHNSDKTCTCETPTEWMHQHGNTKPEVRHKPGKGL